MLDTIKEYLKGIFETRLIPIAVVFIMLFMVLVYRMFELQVVNPEEYTNTSGKKDTYTREVKASRGKIYDCNGKLLAYNKLTHNVTYERNQATGNLTSKERNKMIYRLMKILGRQGEKLSVEFYIEFDKNNVPQFTISGNSLLRFKAEVYSKKVTALTQEQRDASAEEVYKFLRYDMGSDSPKFDIGHEYDDETAIQIMAVRYTMYINRFNSYQKLTLAKDVSDETMSAIKENNPELPGIDIADDTIRVYKNSKYFAHILGYTGAVTEEKLNELTEKNPNTDYTLFDQIGISGIESSFEKYLKGKKGTEEIITDDSTGRVEDVKLTKSPVTGSDVYLTIDSKLQIECYKLLEEHIAGILISNINNSDSAGSKGTSASQIKVPITDVYSALIDNNIVNASRFTDKSASNLEKQTYRQYKTKSKVILNNIKSILNYDSNKTSKNIDKSMVDFVDYFFEVLKNNSIISVDSSTESYDMRKKYSDGTISVSDYLRFAIKHWVDLDKIDIGDAYLSQKEIYDKLIKKGLTLLKEDVTYPKMVYSYLIHQHELSGRDVCLLLFDQGNIKYNAKDYRNLKLGMISPYSFLINKIKKLEITPGQLGLEPCSGSIIVTDVNTGQVKAMVSYPSYDNNKMANQVDSDYFNTYLTQAKASPLLNRATQQKLAPGSTFKVLSSIAGVQEGVISPSTTIVDRVKFDKIPNGPSCWNKAGHGSLHLATALEVSCNYFFYTVGFKLGDGKDNGTVDNEKGLARLKKYADMFGLTKTSGVEISEAKPKFSDTDIVRSAIGQGSHAYTPSQIARYVTTVANNGTCFNLTLIDKVKNVKGKVVYQKAAKVINKVNIPESTWSAVHHGMYLVANGPDSAENGMFSGIKQKVAGKTGTAQQNAYHSNHAWFMSYAPFNNPEISVTCLIPNGYASSNAAQTVRDVYKYYFSKGKKNVSGQVKMPESTENHMD